MMRHTYFYALATGIFTGQFSIDPDDSSPPTIPAGCGAYAGSVIDPYSTKLELATGLVVDYQPPAPADTSFLTYAWDTASRRWVSTPTAANLNTRLQAAFTAAIQARLDDFARTRSYDGILSACTYATSGVPKFAAEGQCCVAGRDATWAAAYALLAAVEAGTSPMPTMDAVLAVLPVLAWPA